MDLTTFNQDTSARHRGTDILIAKLIQKLSEKELKQTYLDRKTLQLMLEINRLTIERDNYRKQLEYHGLLNKEKLYTIAEQATENSRPGYYVINNSSISGLIKSKSVRLLLSL